MVFLIFTTSMSSFLSVFRVHRDLGVLVYSNLKHIREVLRKAEGLAAELLRFVPRSSVFTMSLFVSHIRPVIGLLLQDLESGLHG